MSSYSDYIASKRISIINNVTSSNTCNAPCINASVPIYDGACYSGCEKDTCYAGPTGPSGDKYLSYFNDKTEQNRVEQAKHRVENDNKRYKIHYNGGAYKHREE